MFISLTLTLAPMCVNNVDTVEATQDNNTEIQVSNSAQDKSLGPVNLCDPEGKVCLFGNAYIDNENSRIYVTNVSPNKTIKYYSQRSNDERWPWMIRIDKNWYYFGF